MQVSGNQVKVDILEQSRFTCRGVDICHTSIGLVLMMVNEIDLKSTLRTAERKRTESPPDEES